MKAFIDLWEQPTHFFGFLFVCCRRWQPTSEPHKYILNHEIRYASFISWVQQCWFNHVTPRFHKLRHPPAPATPFEKKKKGYTKFPLFKPPVWIIVLHIKVLCLPPSPLACSFLSLPGSVILLHFLRTSPNEDCEMSVIGKRLWLVIRWTGFRPDIMEMVETNYASTYQRTQL